MSARDDYKILACVATDAQLFCWTEARAALDEIDRLRQWKAEASEVLDGWEGVWILAGQPGRLGTSKRQAVAQEIQRLCSERDAWMNGVADAVEPLGYDRQAACGPSDLLPGLETLAELAHGANEAWRELPRLRGVAEMLAAALLMRGVEAKDCDALDEWLRT